MNYTKEEVQTAITRRSILDDQDRLDILNSKSMQELLDILANMNAGELVADVSPPPVSVTT